MDQNGRLNLDELSHKIRDDTILVSLMYVNNEVGIINPIHEVREIISQKIRKQSFMLIWFRH